MAREEQPDHKKNSAQIQGVDDLPFHCVKR
jgi:hypothetical protein